MTGMTIGEAARTANVSVETVRFYERRQLIQQPPKPRFGGFRRYPEDTVRRIRFIRQAQTLGFSLREAAELLKLRDDAETDAGDFQVRAQEKLKDVEIRIAQMQEISRVLRRLLEVCPGQGPLTGCSILGALEADEPATIEPTQSIGDSR